MTYEVLTLKADGSATMSFANARGSGSSGSGKWSVSGDKISITSNKETKTYYIVIYGDLNGDAKINAKDLLALRKYLLNEQKLNGSYLKAASITRNSKVTAKDLLALRKYLLGEEKISQL